MERLAARARAAGLERVTAPMIVGNDAARALIGRAAEIVSETREAGAISLIAQLRR
jgi:hypothetical protein